MWFFEGRDFANNFGKVEGIVVLNLGIKKLGCIGKRISEEEVGKFG